MLFNKNLCTKRLSARFLSLFDVTILPNLLLFCDNHPVSQVAKMLKLLPYKAHILTRKKILSFVSSVQTSKKENYENFGSFGSDTSKISVTSKNSVISKISITSTFRNFLFQKFKHTSLL